MARKKKSEGEEVRLAYDGPSLDHDEMIGHMEARNREDSSRASSAGESRSQIGEFLEATGMNAKAYAWCRQILKKPDTQKAMDIILSLEAALPLIKAHVTGQQAEFDLKPADPEPIEPFDGPLPKPSYDATFDPHEDMDAEEKFGEPAEAQDDDPDFDDIEIEADEFEAELAKAAE